MIKDTELHERVTGLGNDRRKRETRVIPFFDLKKAKICVYSGHKRLEYALVNLAYMNNRAVRKKLIEGGIEIGFGDIIHRCVVAYQLRGKLHKPNTTKDSPLYSTLPYKLVESSQGSWRLESAIPREARIHFQNAKIVGDLIPILTEEERNIVRVAIQLKEIHKPSKKDLERLVEIQTQRPQIQDYEHQTNGNGEWASFIKDLNGIAKVSGSETYEWGTNF